MKWLGRWSRRGEDEEVEVNVSESGGIRYLHLGSQTVQSAMRIANPDQLVLAYTRSAMGFLLFKPQLSRVTSVGLGGGSMQKWLWRHFPALEVHTVELHEQVLRAAQQHFGVPDGDERFHVTLDDGARWVAQHVDFSDVLLVDGYHGRGQSDAVCSEAFYAQARAHLREDGILAVNLWGSDKRFDDYLERLEATFEGRVLCLPAAEKGNVIALAFRRAPQPTDWEGLMQRARELEAAHQLEFTQMVPLLRRLNLYNDKRLLI